ncbi:3-(3-hydroxy-phenyl)propionate/3-hydroxycinnamic acid hydroxylase [compost metagenome]
MQDAENLAWKLALVLAGRAGDALLDSYASEREVAADENIRHSTRSTDFITPKSAVSRTFRDAVLRLARRHAFARQLVNSGRLSLPTVLADSPLNTPDRDVFAGAMVPGAPCADAPLQRHGDAQPGWLLGELGELGNGFTLLVFGDASTIPADARRRLATAAVPVRLLIVVPPGQPAAPPDGLRHVSDAEGLAARRYDGHPGTCYLIRPDQHVCARWRAFDAEAVQAALLRALCQPANGQMH